MDLHGIALMVKFNYRQLEILTFAMKTLICAFTASFFRFRRHLRSSIPSIFSATTIVPYATTFSIKTPTRPDHVPTCRVLSAARPDHAPTRSTISEARGGGLAAPGVHDGSLGIHDASYGKVRVERANKTTTPVTTLKHNEYPRSTENA